MIIFKGYTSERIYRLADDFFKSMDMEAAPESFWRNSVFRKPSDREMVCHPSTWDFSSENDVRLVKFYLILTIKIKRYNVIIHFNT